MVKILGIETSCDETAAAIVNSDKEILSHVVLSQLEQHKPYGGVVPEIAARAHIDILDELIKKTMSDANIDDFAKLDGIAVTGGPGLIGGVIVGVMMAKAIASCVKIPFIPVNHLEGHALTARLTDEIDFPFLLLLVSGGHCQILSVLGVGKYELLGSTIDDALGEAFDKLAKMLGLGYPGGPIIEKLAKQGNGNRFDLPRPLKGKKNCDFSFSGLKTAVRLVIEKLPKPHSEQDINDLCASFQNCCGDILQEKIKRALDIFSKKHPEGKDLVVAGGVAANQYLRSRLEDVAKQYNYELKAPPIKLCTDNAAMIAWAGIEQLNDGFVGDLSFEPKARWPLYN